MPFCNIDRAAHERVCCVERNRQQRQGGNFRFRSEEKVCAGRAKNKKRGEDLKYLKERKNIKCKTTEKNTIEEKNFKRLI